MIEPRYGSKAELRMIEEVLWYDDSGSCLFIKYPYLYCKDLLQGSREVTMKSMLSTERSLKKELNLREVVTNHIPHLAALNSHSRSSPITIIFDVSRVQGGGQV